MAGLKEVIGEEETLRSLANPYTAEEISDAARRHTLAEIATALADARAAGAARWAWMARRLREGRKP